MSKSSPISKAISFTAAVKLHPAIFEQAYRLFPPAEDPLTKRKIRPIDSVVEWVENKVGITICRKSVTRLKCFVGARRGKRGESILSPYAQYIGSLWSPSFGSRRLAHCLAHDETGLNRYGLKPIAVCHTTVSSFVQTRRRWAQLQKKHALPRNTTPISALKESQLMFNPDPDEMAELPSPLNTAAKKYKNLNI